MVVSKRVEDRKRPKFAYWVRVRHPDGSVSEGRVSRYEGKTALLDNGGVFDFAAGDRLECHERRDDYVSPVARLRRERRERRDAPTPEAPAPAAYNYMNIAAHAVWLVAVSVLAIKVWGVL